MARNTEDERLPREGVVPDVETEARMQCAACGAEFLRREVESTRKGRLVCPNCGSRDIADVTDSTA